MRVCHQCGTDIGTVERVGRRAACLKCAADLHCCLNCAFHEPKAHNHCREPQRERQVDEKAGNHCEYFSFRIGPRAAGTAAAAQEARARLEALFAATAPGAEKK